MDSSGLRELSSQGISQAGQGVRGLNTALSKQVTAIKQAGDSLVHVENEEEEQMKRAIATEAKKYAVHVS